MKQVWARVVVKDGVVRYTKEDAMHVRPEATGSGREEVVDTERLVAYVLPFGTLVIYVREDLLEGK